MIETEASALQWHSDTKKSFYNHTLYNNLPVAREAALSHTKQMIKNKKVFGLNGSIMHTIQNDCCVKVLGVSQIIRENPEIINKTDSQNRNIMPDLKQPSKNNSSMKVIKML